ncbi:MAG: TonB-dependent receptor [Tannerella sp.]|nr:TonB-dependent receptor [Tannerella sp.]
MKLTVCLWLLFSGFIFAEDLSSQNVRVSLNKHHALLKDVLEEIERQTDYLFISNSEINLERRVSVRVKNKPVREVLDRLFKDTDLTYAVEGVNIIITKKAVPPETVAMPQQTGRQITGRVTDAFGEPVVGANIVEKGATANGTVTDVDGKFSLSVADNAVLQVSYIGYLTQEVRVGQQTVLNIALVEDMQSLEEIVVVGYGTQKKVNLTGAVASVDMSKLVESRPITSLSAGLAGLAAGVHVNQGSGRPGYDGATIRVRGQGTLNNSDPLIVIDGTVGNMNDVNPQDVESISILKDASSSSIYGSRAANGVILVTTRKGREGSAKVTYNGYLASQNIANKMDIVSNYADYMELVNEGLRNSGQATPFSQAKIDEWRNAGDSDPVKYPNTDWQDVAFRQGWQQNHTLSVSDGTDKIRYFVSGNFLQNQGIMENSAYDRISARANLDATVKPWFTIGVNAYGYKGKAEPGQDNADTGFIYLLNTSPGMCLRAPDGRYGGVNNSEDDSQAAANNILMALNGSKGNKTTNKVVSRFFGLLRPLKGLSIESSFTYDFTNTYRYSQPVFIDLWNFYDNTLQRSGTGRTSVTNADEKWVRHQMDGIARYETNVSRLNIQAMLGASQETYRYNWFTASKLDLTAPELTELNAATADASATGNYTNWAMHSYFGRLALNWADKYLLEANLRTDKSSRFAPGSTRSGIFPSFSAGWRVSEEEFLRSQAWIDNLKVRLSYGSLGNDNVGDYSWQRFYTAQNYVLNNAVQIGFAQTALSNALLTWETTYVSNLGIDFGLLKSRLSGSIDLFVKNTKGILIDLPAPLVHGNASVPRKNAAEVRNAGGELNLTWNDKIGNVGYFIGGNFSYIKNEVTKFKGKESSISGTNMILEGEPINIQYVLLVDRLIQTDEDLAIVQAMVDKNPDAFASYRRPEKGDFLYKDVSGVGEDGLPDGIPDGKITDADRVKIGNGTNPTITYGINFGLSWKGFDFSGLLQGIGGLQVYWDGADGAAFTPLVARGRQINKTIADGRWYEGRTDAVYPRLLNSDNRNYVASDFWLQDKSYMRVKNIQLGYTLPRRLSKQILLETLRIYASIDNALTFTNYQGLDPEVNGTRYPTIRTTTFGINLTF